MNSQSELSQMPCTAADRFSSQIYGGEFITWWKACECVFTFRVPVHKGFLLSNVCASPPQVGNTKATNHCGSTRGGTRSLERQTLCTREVTGRPRIGRTGACVLTSSNPGTYQTSADLTWTGSSSASGPGAMGRSWLGSTVWTFVSMRVCSVRFTHSQNTLYLQMYSHSVFVRRGRSLH